MGKCKIQIQESIILMSRLLCGYSRKKHEKDTGIYSESAEGGSNSRAARTGDRRSVYGK